jgi:peptidoglycan/LPS O-acetylase OafA/YrhL
MVTTLPLPPQPADFARASHEPGSVRDRSGRFHRPELDALRLLAFLMVWLSHSLPSLAELSAHGFGGPFASWLATVKDAGRFGVCVFFFLSAYLITELLQREIAVAGTVSLPAFYIRRILRIWPLYLGVLAVYGLLGLGFHGFRIEPGRLLASVLLAGNWYIALHPAILTPMRALWSISVEEQFYLAWPLVFKWGSRSVVVRVACGVLGISALSTVVLARAQPAAWLAVTLWVNSLVQFQYFALGALTAIVLRGRAPALPSRVRVAAAAAAAALALTAAGLCFLRRPHDVSDLESRLHPPAALTVAGGYLLAGTACLLLFLAVLGLKRVPQRAITLGKISFGLYVFHETGFFLADALFRRVPALVAFSAEHWAWAFATDKALALALTICIALASYRFWEKPFLRLKDRFTLVRSRLA